MLLFPALASPPPRTHRAVTCHPRLGGLLNFYQHAMNCLTLRAGFGTGFGAFALAETGNYAE
jgi:hypothetical protein